MRNGKEVALLREFVQPVIADAKRFTVELTDFLHSEAKLPGLDKNFQSSVALKLLSRAGKRE